MRLNNIYAGMSCLFIGMASPAISLAAKNTLTIEQRLTLLEQRLNRAENEAEQAKIRATRAEQQVRDADERARIAENRVQQLENRTTSVEQKTVQTEKKVDATALASSASSPGDNGFEFSGYARSGMLINGNGHGAHGGPGVSPASSIGGDAHVGRLGNEKDNYVELGFIKHLRFDDGSKARFKAQLADGASNPDP